MLDALILRLPARRGSLPRPRGDDSVFATYQGTGGVLLGGFLQRLLFAIHFRFTDVPLSPALTPESRVPMHRRIPAGGPHRALPHLPSRPYLADGRLVVGTGTHGALPVTRGLLDEAKRRKIEPVILPTVDAVDELKRNPEQTNFALHITC